MAFDNVTFFEVHLDDATFSSGSGTDPAETVETVDEVAVGEETMDEETTGATVDVDAAEPTPSRGRGFVRFVAVAAVVGIAYAAMRRRRAGEGDAGTDPETTAAAVDEGGVEHVSVDEAVEQ